MTDRVYPSAKPATVNGGGAASGPAPAKPQLYNPNRHPYRPNPTRGHRRSRRSCLCCCCFWTILTLILLVLLAAIAACAAYLIYSPRRPTFSVSALRITRFNLTTSAADGTTRLTAAVNLTISAKNPNKKITYSYDPMSLYVYSDQALIANGSLPSFVSYPKTPNILRSMLSSSSALIDADYVSRLTSDLKRKNGLPLEIKMDTDVVVRMGKLKTRKVGIRVICEGIKGILPKGKSVSSSSTTDAKCKVDLRIKIWKFTF